MNDGYTVAYLLPRPTPHQVVERAEVEVDPAPDERWERIDVFGNRVLQVGVHRSHDELTLHAASDVVVEPAPDLPPGVPWETAAAAVRELRGGEALTVRAFVGRSPYIALDRHGAELRAFAEQAFPPGRPVVEGARALGHEIFETFSFDPAFTDVSTPLSEVLTARRGVCQDFAHLAITCCRAFGLPARYVSGYLLTYPPPGMEKLQGADASHAWLSVWAPEAGWVDFDPTNGIMPAEEHITVAYGRDYDDVSPISGVLLGGSRQTMDVAVDVVPRKA
jgi:transglutaminase-like putative cysteine protease